jgi:hypothetical protein
MLEPVFREYARSKGLDRDYLENLAGFFLQVARQEGEAEAVRLVLGEDPELGPYLEVDLRDAPRTHAWLAAFREMIAQGAQLVVKQKGEDLSTLYVLPPAKVEA